MQKIYCKLSKETIDLAIEAIKKLKQPLFVRACGVVHDFDFGHKTLPRLKRLTFAQTELESALKGSVVSPNCSHILIEWIKVNDTEYGRYCAICSTDLGERSVNGSPGKIYFNESRNLKHD